MNRLHEPNTRTVHWMRELAFHYEHVKRSYPQDKLMLVFDIDETILDTRYMMLSTMKAYDREHGTGYFFSLRVENITMLEAEVLSLLGRLKIGSEEQQRILSWLVENFWTTQPETGSFCAYKGVFDVIRWFQLQPNTHVGLNTGRDEFLRDITLDSLNAVGREYRVRFSSEHLHMNAGGDILEQKAEGIRYFQDLGYRVFAMVDNEPLNLRAVAQRYPEKDILLLHADTIFESSRMHVPEGAAIGRDYDLTELIQEKSLPQHIQFVWHGVNEDSVLRQFLASTVHWAELQVRRDIAGNRIILRRRSLKDLPLQAGEELVSIEDVLSVLGHTDRGVRLDLKDTGLAGEVVKLLKGHGFEAERLWFSSSLYTIQKRGIKHLLSEFPGSICQTPVDFMSGLAVSSPFKFRALLDRIRALGFSRFSVNWKTRNCRRMVTEIQNRGYDVNIYDVPDLEAFLQAVLLMPRSVTSYFNFPKWFYCGSSHVIDLPAPEQRKSA